MFHYRLFIMAVILFWSISSSHATCSSKTRNLQFIKEQILLRLGLDKEPNNPPTNVEPSLLDEFEAIQRIQELDKAEDDICVNLDFHTKKIIPFQPVNVQRLKPLSRSAAGDDCASDPSVDFNNIYKVKFQIDLSDVEFITEAQLRLRKTLLDASKNISNKDRIAIIDRLDVSLITRPVNYFNETLPDFITSTFLDPHDTNDLVVINITDAIVKWLKEESNGQSRKGEIVFELRIRCPQPLAHENTFLPNFQFFSESDSAGQLVITTYLENEDSGYSYSRQKRQTISTFCDPDTIKCCLNEHRVHFKNDLNWTWIIRPPEISFNYCIGECPIRWLDTNHANFLHTLRERVKQNPAAAAEPCCIPNSFKPIHLYIDVLGKESLVKVEDLAATSCICR